MKIAMLGSGFIARFYADSLAAQRRKDVLVSVYSRSMERAEKFAKNYDVPHYSSNLTEVVENPEVDVVVIALSNDLHLGAVEACAKAGKHVLCTKHWGGPAKRLKR